VKEVNSPKKRPEVDWSKIRVGNVYLSDLSPEERKKYEPYLTPEKRAEYQRLAILEDQDREWARAEAEKGHQEAMRNGVVPHMARFVLMQERKQQGLSDEDIMARSGLDAEALASMTGRDAKPSVETMEAYARALGKQLLMVLADAEEHGEAG
jgi:hypothetical protein